MKLNLQHYEMIVQTLENSGYISYQQKQINPNYILRDKNGKQIGKIDPVVFEYMDFENISIDGISINTNVLYLGNYRNNYNQKSVYCFVDSQYKKTLKDFL